MNRQGKKREKDKDSHQNIDVKTLLADNNLPLLHKLILINLLFKSKDLKPLYDDNLSLIEKLGRELDLIGYSGWRTNS